MTTDAVPKVKVRRTKALACARCKTIIPRTEVANGCPQCGGTRLIIVIMPAK